MKRPGRVFAILLGAAGACFAAQTTGVSQREYLDLMQTAVAAYSDAHLAQYLADVEREGVQEHGFPRLAANLGVLVANGRALERRDILKRMLDACCRDAARGKMPPKSGGNEFSVKELVLAVSELARHQTFPAATIDAWRKSLSAVRAERCYTTGLLKTGEPRARNWVVFACASEQARLAHGLGGDAAFVEKYVADQLRWFDANGMYRDPHQPAVYDFVTRLQFAVILRDGYNGPSRAKLEALMDASAEPTLAMLSATGEIPYGGRSNQFLHNNTFYAALCEWYAARFSRRGDAKTAARFRLAARRAVEALRPWLAIRPLSHVKNLYPREEGKGVYSEKGDMGCERYAYFDKYMVTMGSWAMLGWLFADERISAAPEAPFAPECFVTSPDFHFVFLRAGDYSAQFDYNSDPHYDCDGLGRLQRRGAPATVCLATPCAQTPNYRVESPNVAPLALAPVLPAGGKLEFVRAFVEGGDAVAEWRLAPGGAVDWTCRLGETGLVSVVRGTGAVAMTLPAFAFDGRDAPRLEVAPQRLAVHYRGSRCVYATNGEIVDTGRTACNRNGRYRVFEARGSGALTVAVRIACPDAASGFNKQ